jgi:hypothetical protein
MDKKFAQSGHPDRNSMNAKNILKNIIEWNSRKVILIVFFQNEQILTHCIQWYVCT